MYFFAPTGPEGDSVGSADVVGRARADVEGGPAVDVEEGPAEAELEGTAEADRCWKYFKSNSARLKSSMRRL